MGQQSPVTQRVLMADMQKCTDDTNNKHVHLDDKGKKREVESEVVTEREHEGNKDQNRLDDF